MAVILIKDNMKRLRKKILHQYRKYKSIYNSDKTAGDIAKKYNVPVGEIGCPICGSTTIGLLTDTCKVCDNKYFKN